MSKKGRKNAIRQKKSFAYNGRLTKQNLRKLFKKQKKSKVAASQGFSVAQAGQFAVAALVEYRSYWLFGGAALAIFFGGDNASV